MKRAATILSFLTAFLLATSCAVSWAGVKPEAPVIANPPEEWLGEPETLPLLPVPEDPNELPPLPEKVKKILSAKYNIFDISVVKGDLKGYPFPHVKVVYVASMESDEKVVVSLVVALYDNFKMPDTVDENSILEVKWFSTRPENLNSATELRTERWINLPLIKKIIEELMGEKPDEKIKI